MTEKQAQAIIRHGSELLKLFPNATERDPLALCRKLRRLEGEARRNAERYYSVEGAFPDKDAFYGAQDTIHAKVRRILGIDRQYQPKTGAACSCRKGIERDNCPRCEGTGMVVDFATIRASKAAPRVFVNNDPRGYALKIDDEWMRANASESRLHRDWGGYGIIAPDINSKGE